MGCLHWTRVATDVLVTKDGRWAIVRRESGVLLLEQIGDGVNYVIARSKRGEKLAPHSMNHARRLAEEAMRRKGA